MCGTLLHKLISNGLFKLFGIRHERTDALLTKDVSTCVAVCCGVLQCVAVAHDRTDALLTGHESIDLHI